MDITDKIYEYLSDFTRGSVISNCCGATVYYEDICGDCKEHCTPIYNDIECEFCEGGISALDFEDGYCTECGKKYGSFKKPENEKEFKDNLFKK